VRREAASNKVRGLAEAEVRQAQGLAEAEVIKARGEAEGEVMQAKAAAYHEYNQAAVMDKLITSLPEIVRAVAEPLSKVEKVTVISTGEGDDAGLGVSRLTTDIVNIVVQTPTLFEALTGQRVSDLMRRIPGINVETPDGVSTNGAQKVTVVVGTQDTSK
jgi:flotillin